MIINFVKPIFVTEKLWFLKYKNLLFLKNPFYASHPQEYRWSQGDSRGPKWFWGSQESRRLEGVLGVPEGPRVPEVLGSHFSTMPIKMGLQMNKYNLITSYLLFTAFPFIAVHFLRCVGMF